jgi:hypothetical protein
MDPQKTHQPVNAPRVAPRLTMRLVFHQMVERFFDIEKGWLRTVLELTLGPGAMMRRYVEGHRTVYANPFAYLVLGTAVNFIAQKVVGFQERMVSVASANTMDSPLQMEFANRFTELVLQNGLYVSVGILLPLALLLRVLFRKSGYNLAECLVFALYTVGHLSLLGIVLVPLYMLLPPSTTLQGVVGITVAIIYAVYAARGFFRGNFVVIAVKTAVAYVMAYAVFMIVMMALVVVYVIAVLAPTASAPSWDLVTATDYEAIPVIEKMLDEGADVNATLERTPLHAAAENGSLEIVELLIAGGADVNLQDIHGRVPIYVALAANHMEIARRLAEEETDLTVQTVDGSTLLVAALVAEDEEFVRWALDRGVDVNAIRPKKNYATALMIAAAKGKPEIVELLLSHGADPGVSNHENRTALDLAKNQEVKELLLAAATNQTPTHPESEAEDNG